MIPSSGFAAMASASSFVWVRPTSRPPTMSSAVWVWLSGIALTETLPMAPAGLQGVPL